MNDLGGLVRPLGASVAPTEAATALHATYEIWKTGPNYGVTTDNNRPFKRGVPLCTNALTPLKFVPPTCV
jgi:hypothetical protein